MNGFSNHKFQYKFQQSNKINNKSKRWVLDKYFQSDGKRKWCFKEVIEDSGKINTFVLKKLSDIPISRHVKIKKEANPFDVAWDAYFGKRRFERLKVQLLRQHQFIGSTHYGGVAPV